MFNPAIKFDNVSKIFPRASKYAVFETSLEIEEGSFVTVLGTSGSGKTTLLKMVNRIYEQTSGHIFIQNEDIATIEVTRLRKKIGYVIQQIGLFPHMTVEDNIAIVPKILKWDEERQDRRINSLLELVHLPPGDFRKRYPRQLSGGQQQRVGLARAMAGDPSIMLMDEPFGAIDAITRASLQDELLKIQRQLHKTILFVTHDINEALKLGDKVVVMHEGRIQQYDTPFNIIMQPANCFVSELVSSEDILQQLSYLKADSAIGPLEGVISEKAVKISKQETLKNVLIHILTGEYDYVIVKDEEDNLIGKIDMSRLKIKFTEI